MCLLIVYAYIQVNNVLIYFDFDLKEILEVPQAYKVTKKIFFIFNNVLFFKLNYINRVT